MVEMYIEETGDMDMDSNSSSENAVKATKGENRTSEGRFATKCSSTATERCSTGQLMDSKSNHVPDVEMAGSSVVNFHNGVSQKKKKKKIP